MYLVLSLVVLIISALLFKRAAGSLSIVKLNMISWIFYFNIILQSFIAAVFVVNNWDNHYMLNKISDPGARTYGYWAIMYTMLAFPAGILVAKRGLSFLRLKRGFKSYTNTQFEYILSPKESYVKVGLYCLTFFSLLAVTYTLWTVGEIALLKAASAPKAAVLAEFRQDVSREFEGNYIIRNVFALTLTPILSYVAYAYWVKSKSLSNLAWFLLLALASVLILTYNLEKAPLIIYLTGFVFARVLIRGRIKTASFVAFSLFSLGLIILLYLYVMGDNWDLLLNYNTGILGRILFSQSAGTFFSFDIFPGRVEFLGFSSLSDFFSTLLSLPHSERSARIIMETVNPEGVALDIAGVVNSLFIAEAWANFGWLGLIIAPWYVGFIIGILYNLLLNLPKSPIFIGLFVYFSCYGSITGGFNDYIYNPLIFLICICFSGVLFFAYYLKIAKNNLDILDEKENNLSPSL